MVGDVLVEFRIEVFGDAPVDNLDSRAPLEGNGSFAIVSNITLFFFDWSDPPGRPGRNPLFVVIDVIMITYWKL